MDFYQWCRGFITTHVQSHFLDFRDNKKIVRGMNGTYSVNAFKSVQNRSSNHMMPVVHCSFTWHFKMSTHLSKLPKHIQTSMPL
ncbi:hypothetical protein OS493_010209 [Desmophyllum pertusum]|uniref:Uncharacterized protein n=1 Tax=Desmophyllum pertusum TaxID=174260 RepID=A0A9X0D9R4_9CNID|nr:hypothetical protein OS493_010209 [Desmophyllum pertusum]